MTTSKRENVYLDAETRDRLTALTRDDLGKPIYASRSEAIRVAVERLAAFHFQPTSSVSDEMLDRLHAQAKQMLGTVEYELMRRADLKDDE